MNPRPAICAECDARAPLAVDTQTVVAYPIGWHRIGWREDATPILRCTACLMRARDNPNEGA